MPRSQCTLCKKDRKRDRYFGRSTLETRAYFTDEVVRSTQHKTHAQREGVGEGEKKTSPPTRHVLSSALEPLRKGKENSHGYKAQGGQQPPQTCVCGRAPYEAGPQQSQSNATLEMANIVCSSNALQVPPKPERVIREQEALAHGITLARIVLSSSSAGRDPLTPPDEEREKRSKTQAHGATPRDWLGNRQFDEPNEKKIQLYCLCTRRYHLQHHASQPQRSHHHDRRGQTSCFAARVRRGKGRKAGWTKPVDQASQAPADGRSDHVVLAAKVSAHPIFGCVQPT